MAADDVIGALTSVSSNSSHSVTHSSWGQLRSN